MAVLLTQDGQPAAYAGALGLRVTCQQGRDGSYIDVPLVSDKTTTDIRTVFHPGSLDQGAITFLKGLDASLNEVWRVSYLVSARRLVLVADGQMAIAQPVAGRYATWPIDTHWHNVLVQVRTNDVTLVYDQNPPTSVTISAATARTTRHLYVGGMHKGYHTLGDCFIGPVVEDEDGLAGRVSLKQLAQAAHGGSLGVKVLAFAGDYDPALADGQYVSFDLDTPASKIYAQAWVYNHGARGAITVMRALDANGDRVFDLQIQRGLLQLVHDSLDTPSVTVACGATGGWQQVRMQLNSSTFGLAVTGGHSQVFSHGIGYDNIASIWLGGLAQINDAAGHVDLDDLSFSDTDGELFPVMPPGDLPDTADLAARVNVYEPVPTVIYNDTDGFDLWSGHRRVFANVMRLAFSNMAEAPGLNIEQPLFHYRWGTLQAHDNTPDDGRDAAPGSTGTRTMVLNADGLQADPGGGTGVAYVDLPGSAVDYRYLYESTRTSPPIPPAPAGVYDSFVIGCWTYLTPDDYRVILGGHFRNDPDFVGTWVVGSITLAAGRFNNDQILLSCQLHRRMLGFQQASLYTDYAMAATSAWRHILLHQFFTRSADEQWWYARWFIDGKFQQQTKVRMDQDHYWFAMLESPESSPVRLDMMQTKKPVLGAMARSVQPWNGSDYGTNSYCLPYEDTLDEVMLAHCHPVLDGDDPVVDHTWVPGDQAFSARRHPDPVQWGLEAEQFTLLSPVVLAGYGAGTSIYQVQVTFATLTSGQNVAVSVRASDQSFDPGNTSIAWSDWNIIDDPSQNGQIVPVNGGGYGQYVQMRLRVLPSSDGLTSPQITRVQWWARYNAYEPDNATLPARVQIGDYATVAARVKVFQRSDEDLAARVVVVYAPPGVTLPARVFVQGTGQADLPARVYQSFWSINLAARVQVTPGDADEQTLAARVVVERNDQDLPARVFIMAMHDLMARVNVQAHVLAGRVLVQRAVNQTLAARVTVPPEVPGDVEPLTASVPEASWQDESQIIFTWSLASWQALPVVGYYWKVTSAALDQADQTWYDTTQLTAQIDLASPQYGSGIWYFHVAARNTGGYFGATAHYEVRWNSPPGAPGQSFMTANGRDTLYQVPLIACTTAPALAWSVASDVDPGEIITYQVQVADSEDFDNIIWDEDELGSASVSLSPIPEPGIWFWRVRASDGKQFSSWSPIGGFQLNDPPTAPTDLQVAAS